MASQQMQENRFELKYILDEVTARAVRDYARSYLVADEHADPAKGWSYPIHSVYLDSPDYTLCRATIQGLKNRFKLRVRYYDDNPALPVFFEIKRRINDVILKRRAMVRREAMAMLLAGHWPSTSDLVKPNDAKAFDSLQQFCELRHRLNASGKVIVSYVREAWVTAENNSVRLTFDRNLAGLPWRGQLTCKGLTEGVRPEVAGVILELKFTDRFPDWMRTMVQGLNLQRRSMAKYVHCVEALRPAVSLTTFSQFEATV